MADGLAAEDRIERLVIALRDGEVSLDDLSSL